MNEPLIKSKHRSCKDILSLMFDKSNPQNVRWCCTITWVIPFVIFIIGVCWLAILGLGYGSTRVTYGSVYNMTDGKPLFVGDKTNLQCNNKLGGNLFGWCTWNGLFALLIILFFGFFCFGLGMCLIELRKVTKEFCKENNIAKLIRNIIDWGIVILMVLLIPILYFVTIYLGLASSYILYSETYNMSTGWPKNADYSKGILMCRHTSDNSFFMGCMFSGVVTDIIIFFAITIGGGLLCLLVMVICSPFYYCFKSCIDSYNFSKNFGISTSVTIQINEKGGDEEEEGEEEEGEDVDDK